jgi:hypothetical protein
VHISVRYTPDLVLSFRLHLYLLRKLVWVLVIIGTLLVIYGVAILASAPGAGVYLIAIGVVAILEGPVLVWLRVYRSREVFRSEVEVTITSEGTEWRTDTTTIHLTWDKLQRIHESNDLWVFIANRQTRIAVAKRALSRDQRAELAAFIAARPTANNLAG